MKKKIIELQRSNITNHNNFSKSVSILIAGSDGVFHINILPFKSPDKIIISFFMSSMIVFIM